MIVDRKKFLMCVSVALSLILYIYILINLRGIFEFGFGCKNILH